MLEEKVSAFAEACGWDLKSQPTLLAVSGGLDSMVLAHVFLRLKFPFSIAHVNFGLRGAESNADEALVRQFATDHQIPLFVLNPDTESLALQKGISIQMAARELRYDFFADCMQKQHIQLLATAHHGNDALENLFIYLIRGNMEAAFSGIAPMSGNKIRPLWSLCKGDLETYAKEQSIVWREDESNAKTDYLRNKIRHMLVPGLCHFYPEILEDYLELSLDFSAHRQFLEQSFHKLVGRFLTVKDANTVFLDKRILLGPFGNLAARHYLRSLGFHKGVVNQMVSHTQAGGRFDSNKHTIYVETDRFRIDVAAAGDEAYEITIESADLPLQLQAGLFDISLDMVRNFKPDHREPDSWYFALRDLHFPLVMRSRRTGDKMKIWGTGFGKKISDLFTDNKVGNSVKWAYPVLESEDGILGVIGLQRSNIAAVDDNADAVLRIKWICTDEGLLKKR